jgi:hypothetical protein
MFLMKAEVSEPVHPWKTMTVGFVAMRKFGILDIFPAVKTNGYTGFDLRKRKMLLQLPVNPRNVEVFQYNQEFFSLCNYDYLISTIMHRSNLYSNAFVTDIQIMHL